MVADAPGDDDEVEEVSWADQNRELFTRRIAITDELSELTGADGDPVRIAELRRALRDVTDEIVRKNYGLVRSYVSRFTSHTSAEDSADFEAAGVLGLMIAIERYRPEKGSFAPWAYRPIKRQVLRAVRDADHPNLNQGDFDRRPEVLRAQTRLTVEGSPPPTDEAIAEEAGVTIEVVRRVIGAPLLQSLSTPVGDADGDSSLADVVADTDDHVDGVLSQMSVSALESSGLTALDPRELFVIVRRFGLDGEPPCHLSTIGKQLGLSREAARQIESKALAKLMHPITLRRLIRFND
jgi:RNA polymerase sigma factor (sigma-70 family)